MDINLILYDFKLENKGINVNLMTLTFRTLGVRVQ